MSPTLHPAKPKAKPSLCTATRHPHSRVAILMATVVWLAVGAQAVSVDNTCSFRSSGSMFTLALLNRYGEEGYYSEQVGNNSWILFNFCDPFLPKQCSNPDLYDTSVRAYAFLLHRDDTTKLYQCDPYTSDSKTAYFAASYAQDTLNLTLTTKPGNDTHLQAASFLLACHQAVNNQLIDVHADQPTLERLVVYGVSASACPVVELGSIWQGLTENRIIFGVAVFVIGFVMLFFGILMTHLMIFIASYFLSFALLAAAATAVMRPDSSTVAIYFALLLILFLATLVAYGLTRLVNLSIFFIGAFFGFVLAAVVNTLFVGLFGVYSVWSLVFFEVVLVIPLGLLTFKYSEEVIVTSTSAVGSYMVVRPISWILGGFPNEFTLYSMFQNGELKTLPWSFFLYLVFIVAIALLGAFYQILKIKRRRPNHQIESNFITENVEGHIDRIKEAVEGIITKYAPDSKLEEDYKKMKEMDELTPNSVQNYDVIYEEPNKANQRNSKERKSKERKSKEEIF